MVFLKSIQMTVRFPGTTCNKLLFTSHYTPSTYKHTLILVLGQFPSFQQVNEAKELSRAVVPPESRMICTTSINMHSSMGEHCQTDQIHIMDTETTAFGKCHQVEESRESCALVTSVHGPKSKQKGRNIQAQLRGCLNQKIHPENAILRRRENCVSLMLYSLSSKMNV